MITSNFFQSANTCINYSWIDLAIKVAELVTAITAVAAIIYTAISLRIQRKHNELSVKPIPCFNFHEEKNNFSFKLQNNGFGPLIITCFTFQLGKNKNADISALIKNIEYSSKSIGEELSGSSIPPNQSHRFFMFAFENSQKGIENKHKMLGFLKKVTFQFTYKDIYDKEVSSITQLRLFIPWMNF